MGLEMGWNWLNIKDHSGVFLFVVENDRSKHPAYHGFAFPSPSQQIEASETARNLRRFKVDHGTRIREIEPLITQDHWRPAGQCLDFASFDKRMALSVTHAVASAVAPDERSSVPANTAETKSATHG